MEKRIGVVVGDVVEVVGVVGDVVEVVAKEVATTVDLNQVYCWLLTTRLPPNGANSSR